MTMIDAIKAAHLAARKNRDAHMSGFYSTLLGDAQLPGKNAGNRESTDAEVVQVAKKFLKNLNETIALSSTPELVKEKAAVEALLPKQMSEAELSMTLVAIINEIGSNETGKVMKALKEKYAGLYDGAMASSLIKKAQAPA